MSTTIRNNELQQYAEIKLRMKELEATAKKLLPTAEKQYKALLAADKSTAFSFEERGVVKFDAASPRKKFEYSEKFVVSTAKLKVMKDREEAILISEGKFTMTGGAAFACKVTAING